MKEITLRISNQLKNIAILMMLCLHLFNQPYLGLFEPIIFIGSKPLSYYISLFCDICVPIFAFVSGYGLYYKYQQSPNDYSSANKTRIRTLYIKFWIILFLFVVVLGNILGENSFPADFQTFFLNFSALSVSYNGAWWFLTTYLLFVISSGFWFRLLTKCNSIAYVVFLVFLYVFGFYFKIYKTNLYTSPYLNWFQVQVSLYFFSLLQFMLGALTLHNCLIVKVSKLVTKLRLKNTSLVLGIVILVIIHGFLPNLFFAPFICFPFILIYCQLNKADWLQNIIDFFSPHTTNIWLIHMFFYMIYFKDIIYSPKYPILIYIWLLLWCLMSSYVINLLYYPILKWVNLKSIREKK